MDYNIVRSKNVCQIEIYPYMQCWERAVDYFKSLGYSDADINRVGEGEVLFNVPFSAMGCRHRAIVGTDFNNQYCAYLYPYGYKVPGIFFEVVQ